MKDGGRIAAAIEVLEDVERNRRPLQDSLKDWGLAHRFAGSRDRSAIGNLVFDVLRRKASFAAIIGSDSPRALVLATYVLSWGNSVERLTAELADSPHAPAPLTADEAARLSGATFPETTPDHIRADIPEWLEGSFRRAFGDNLVVEGSALAGRADVDIRVNTLKATRDEVMDALGDHAVKLGQWSPVSIRITPGSAGEKPPHVSSELSFKKGWFEVQDEGSQLAALMAVSHKPSQIVDLCAGGGGKTLAMAAALGNHGQIYAYDNDRRRFGDILDRISRSGAHNIQIREPRKADPLADLTGKADLVLVDAPCTGSGTWRRRPDAKWRLSAGALEIRSREQAAALLDAIRLLKVGGRLVYVTCSVLPEENEDRIATFLRENPGFRLADTVAAFANLTGRDAPASTRLTLEGRAGSMLRLTPASTGTDGFFIALLDRTA